MIQKKLTAASSEMAVSFTQKNGDRGTRTPDLCVANASLSQLSYIPIAVYYNANPKNFNRKFAKFKFFQIFMRSHMKSPVPASDCFPCVFSCIFLCFRMFLIFSYFFLRFLLSSSVFLFFIPGAASSSGLKPVQAQRTTHRQRVAQAARRADRPAAEAARPQG